MKMTEINLIPFIGAFVLDIASVLLLAFLFYYRRHKNRDMTIAIAIINITLFALAGALASFTLSLGVGFALFAVISIIRLRSDEAGWVEMAYLLTGLSVGLILGLPGYSLAVQSTYALILVIAIFVIDHPKLMAFGRAKRITLTVDFTEFQASALKFKVEDLIGQKVIGVEVRSITVEPPSMKLDVKYSIA
jgi:hypothetical protein